MRLQPGAHPPFLNDLPVDGMRRCLVQAPLWDQSFDKALRA